MLPRTKTKIAYLRLENGKLSQRQVSEATGIAQKTLSALETGTSQGITFSTLARLCEFFSCTPNDILVLEELDQPRLNFSPKNKGQSLRRKENQIQEISLEQRLANANLTENEKTLYEFLSDEPIQEEVIFAGLGLHVSEVLAAMTMLEINGLMQRHIGGYYSRK